MRRTIAIAALIALAAAGPAAADAPGELVVRFDPGTTARERADAMARAGVVPAGDVALPSTELVAVDGDATRREALDALRAQPGVRWAEPNVVYRALESPDDPLLPRQWALRNTGQAVDGVSGTAGADIGAPAGWALGTGDAAVNVAVVDSGISAGHPDLAPNLSATVAGTDLVDGDGQPVDGEGHGTLVSGIIGARGDDGFGTAGVAWRIGLVPVRVLDDSGGGRSAAIADGFRYAAQRGVRLVNASLGGGSNSSVMSDAIAASPGTLFVVAAGNNGANVDAPGNALYPCVLPLDNVLCVANTDATDHLARTSNWGPASVDIAAPGENITGPAPAYAAPAFADDFESGLGKWVATAGSPWGTEAADGGTALADSPGGPYAPPRGDVIATAAPFSLSGGTGCRLFLTLRLETQAGDGMVAEASANGGPWTAIGSFSGSSEGHTRRISESFGAMSGAASVRLRLRFVANSGLSGDGVSIDELSVACLGGAYDAGDFVTESGTSFAAPHVTGVAAVIMSRYPQLTPLQVKQAILAGATRIPALSGLVATGGRLSFPGAMQAAARLASGTAAPGPAGGGGGTTSAAATFRLKPPVRRGGVWTVDAVLSRTALVETVFERRRPGTGLRGIRARWVVVRTDGPRDRAGGIRIRLGRLGPGVYRVTLRLPEERRVLRRTLTIRARR
ncbi:MAG: S8 family serine peptidase [Thermoleophilia bacterium]